MKGFSDLVINGLLHDMECLKMNLEIGISDDIFLCRELKVLIETFLQIKSLKKSKDLNIIVHCKTRGIKFKKGRVIFFSNSLKN